MALLSTFSPGKACKSINWVFKGSKCTHAVVVVVRGAAAVKKTSSVKTVRREVGAGDGDVALGAGTAFMR